MFSFVDSGGKKTVNKAEKRIRKATFANVEEEFFEIDKEEKENQKISFK